MKATPANMRRPQAEFTRLLPSEFAEPFRSCNISRHHDEFGPQPYERAQYRKENKGLCVSFYGDYCDLPLGHKEKNGMDSWTPQTTPKPPM